MGTKHMKKKKRPSPTRKHVSPSATVDVRENRMDRWFAQHRHADVWVSGILPMVGLLIVYACIGIYPFGHKSVATVDMTQQYIPFYASLKYAVFGGHGLAYSSSLGMGGSYWGLIGYYLASPFAALSLLVPNEALPDYMAWQEIVKVGLAGGAFAYFYSRKFQRHDITVPLLSVCYAMSSFMMVHLCTIIWSDCLVLLPLIVWGLEELLSGKTPWRYVLCLSLAGISNYYMTLMIGIYLVLYVAASLFMEWDGLDAKGFWKKLTGFVSCSLLSVGIAAGILLPSAALLSEYSHGGDEPVSGFWALNPLDLISQMLYHADSHILNDNALPLVYCSVLPLMCLPLFFACKNISARIKISFGCLTGFLMLSLVVNRLNFLWHGAHLPNQLPYRFAFLLVFTLLTMAGMVVDRMDSFSAGTFNGVLVGVMAVTGIVYWSGGRSNDGMLVGTLIFAVGYTVIFFLRANRKMPSSVAIMLGLVLVFVELTSAGVLAWRSIEKESSYMTRDAFVSSYRDIHAAASQMAVSDSDVYRVSILMRESMNNNAMAGCGGLSYFSSTNNGRLLQMLRQAGYNSDERVSYYDKNFTPLMDSVMNVKYVIYAEDAGDLPYLQRVTSPREYQIYRNTLVLPRAFVVSDALRDWSVISGNPFDVQNDFVRCAVSDSDVTVYESTALAVDEEQSFGASFENGVMRFPHGGRLVLTGTSESRKHLYVYVNAEGASDIALEVGEKQYHISDKDTYVIDLGWCDEGERYSVTVTATASLSGSVSAAFLNEAALESSIARLGRTPADFVEYTDHHMVCEVEAGQEEWLFASIPYEKGWRAAVNGKPVEIFPVGGGLMGIPLQNGKNTVELHYCVRMLPAGITISLLSMVLAVVLLFRKEMVAFLRSKMPSR